MPQLVDRLDDLGELKPTGGVLVVLEEDLQHLRSRLARHSHSVTRSQEAADDRLVQDRLPVPVQPPHRLCVRLQQQANHLARALAPAPQRVVDGPHVHPIGDVDALGILLQQHRHDLLGLGVRVAGGEVKGNAISNVLPAGGRGVASEQVLHHPHHRLHLVLTCVVQRKLAIPVGHGGSVVLVLEQDRQHAVHVARGISAGDVDGEALEGGEGVGHLVGHALHILCQQVSHARVEGRSLRLSQLVDPGEEHGVGHGEREEDGGGDVLGKEAAAEGASNSLILIADVEVVIDPDDLGRRLGRLLQAGEGVEADREGEGGGVEERDVGAVQLGEPAVARVPFDALNPVRESMAEHCMLMGRLKPPEEGGDAPGTHPAPGSMQIDCEDLESVGSGND
eukprot:763987-Hanusia_phi.AAC.1